MALCTGVEEVQSVLPNVINVFPNPVTDYLIVYNTVTTNPLTLKIFDATGRQIVNRTISSTKEYIDFTKTAKGIYFVEIMNEETRIYKTNIVKQ